MRIAFVTPIFQQRDSGFRQSGGEISNRVLVEGLAERHHVSVLALLGSPGALDANSSSQLPYAYEWLFPPGPQSFLRRALAVRQLRTRLQSHVATWRPDVIVSATSTLAMALDAGTASGIPVVALVRAFEHAEAATSACTNLRKVGKRIQWGDYSARRFSECSAVVYNSEFLAKWYTDRVGRHRQGVVYPPLDVIGSTETWNGGTGRVLMVGTSALKGIDVTLKVAEMDPDRTYIVAGGDPGNWAAQAPPNVQFVGWQDDRAALYGSVDVVVVPSRWEALGRVPVEALRYGKAVLVSGRGGLPEAVGETRPLIVDTLDVADWLERLNWLETHKADACEAVEAARSTTVRFQPEVQLGRFGELLESVVTKPEGDTPLEVTRSAC